MPAHGLDRERRFDAERVDGFLPRATVAGVLEDTTIARPEPGRRDDLPGRQELALPGATDDDGEDARLAGLEAVAVAASDVGVDLRERAGGDLDACALDRGREPGSERPLEPDLGVDRKASLRGPPCDVGGGLPGEESPAELGGAGEIDGEDGDVDAGPEGLRAARALAGERAVAVGDAEDHAEIGGVIAEHRMDDEVNAVGQGRGAEVAELAGEGRVERAPADEPPEQGAIEDGEPGTFQVAAKLHCPACQRLPPRRLPAVASRTCPSALASRTLTSRPASKRFRSPPTRSAGCALMSACTARGRPCCSSTG